MKPTYRIKDWDDHFETAESRKLKGTRWVPMPTKHDGKGYRRITQHNNAVEIFCAWNLIVQVASKQPVRGVLADSDGPLDADDLAAKTGFPAPIFATALEFLSSESIGWITQEQQRRVRQSARVRQDPPEPPATRQSSSPEGKGIEGNGMEEKLDDSRAGARSLKLTDEEYITELQNDEAYKNLNVRLLNAKMVRWCKEKHKQPTRARLINWLNREDQPLGNGNGIPPARPAYMAGEK